MTMQTVGIKALKTNPSALSKAFHDCDKVLITRRGVPIGIAAPFDEQLIDLGFLRWIAIRSFQAGELSLGQVAKVLGKSKQDIMPLLSTLGVAIADYDLTEDLETLRLLEER